MFFVSTIHSKERVAILVFQGEEADSVFVLRLCESVCLC